MKCTMSQIYHSVLLNLFYHNYCVTVLGYDLSHHHGNNYMECAMSYNLSQIQERLAYSTVTLHNYCVTKIIYGLAAAKTIMEYATSYNMPKMDTGEIKRRCVACAHV